MNIVFELKQKRADANGFTLITELSVLNNKTASSLKNWGGAKTQKNSFF